jgi:hypothetical protein
MFVFLLKAHHNDRLSAAPWKLHKHSSPQNQSIRSIIYQPADKFYRSTVLASVNVWSEFFMQNFSTCLEPSKNPLHHQ